MRVSFVARGASAFNLFATGIAQNPTIDRVNFVQLCARFTDGRRILATSFYGRNGLATLSQLLVAYSNLVVYVHNVEVTEFVFANHASFVAGDRSLESVPSVVDGHGSSRLFVIGAEHTAVYFTEFRRNVAGQRLNTLWQACPWINNEQAWSSSWDEPWARLYPEIIDVDVPDVQLNGAMLSLRAPIASMFSYPDYLLAHQYWLSRSQAPVIMGDNNFTAEFQPAFDIMDPQSGAPPLVNLRSPTFEFIAFRSTSEDDVCPICMEPLPANAEVPDLSCGHAAHVVCIRDWMVQHDTCPICRANLSHDHCLPMPLPVALIQPAASSSRGRGRGRAMNRGRQNRNLRHHQNNDTVLNGNNGSADNDNGHWFDVVNATVDAMFKYSDEDMWFDGPYSSHMRDEKLFSIKEMWFAFFAGLLWLALVYLVVKFVERFWLVEDVDVSTQTPDNWLFDAVAIVDVDRCVICLEDLGRFVPRIACGHHFHGKCLRNWAFAQHYRHATCPTCRRRLRHHQTSSSVLNGHHGSADNDNGIFGAIVAVCGLCSIIALLSLLGFVVFLRCQKFVVEHLSYLLQDVDFAAPELVSSLHANEMTFWWDVVPCALSDFMCLYLALRKVEIVRASRIVVHVHCPMRAYNLTAVHYAMLIRFRVPKYCLIFHQVQPRRSSETTKRSRVLRARRVLPDTITEAEVNVLVDDVEATPIGAVRYLFINNQCGGTNGKEAWVYQNFEPGVYIGAGLYQVRVELTNDQCVVSSTSTVSNYFGFSLKTLYPLPGVVPKFLEIADFLIDANVVFRAVATGLVASDRRINRATIATMVMQALLDMKVPDVHLVKAYPLVLEWVYHQADRLQGKFL